MKIQSSGVLTRHGLDNKRRGGDGICAGEEHTSVLRALASTGLG